MRIAYTLTKKEVWYADAMYIPTAASAAEEEGYFGRGASGYGAVGEEDDDDDYDSAERIDDADIDEGSSGEED